MDKRFQQQQCHLIITQICNNIHLCLILYQSEAVAYATANVAFKKTQFSSVAFVIENMIPQPLQRTWSSN